MSAHPTGVDYRPNVGCALVIAGCLAFWYLMAKVWL